MGASGAACGIRRSWRSCVHRCVPCSCLPRSPHLASPRLLPQPPGPSLERNGTRARTVRAECSARTALALVRFCWPPIAHRPSPSPQIPRSSGTAQGRGQFEQSALLEQFSPLCGSAGHPLPPTPLTRRHRKTTADGRAFNSRASMLSWAIPSPLPSHRYDGPIDRDRGIHPPPPSPPSPLLLSHAPWSPRGFRLAHAPTSMARWDRTRRSGTMGIERDARAQTSTFDPIVPTLRSTPSRPRWRDGIERNRWVRWGRTHAPVHDRFECTNVPGRDTLDTMGSNVTAGRDEIERMQRAGCDGVERNVRSHQRLTPSRPRWRDRIERKGRARWG